MNYLTVLVGLLALATLFTDGNGALLGADKCSYGPAYWCNSFAQAAECSATKLCMEDVWKVKEPQATKGAVDDSTICTYCKDMIADIKSFITNNQTRETILDYLNRACAFMPTEYTDKCKQMEQHYLDEIIALVEQDVNPEKICKLMLFCWNSQQQKKPLPMLSKGKHQLARLSLTKSKTVKSVASGSVICDDCKATIAFVKSQVDDKKNQEAVTNMLNGLCAKLGGQLAKDCQSAITMGMPQVISLVDTELAGDKLCVLIQLCGANDTKHTPTHSQTALFNMVKQLSLKIQSGGMPTVTTECTDCEEVLNYLNIVLKNNETKQSAQSFLEDEVCTQLGAYSDMCKELVEQYFPSIWNTLLDELEPKTFCTLIGLCKSSATASSSSSLDLRSSPQCILCEFLISKLEGLVLKNSTEADIVAAVDKVCSLLPTKFKTECDKLVKEYGPLIVKLLVDDVTPSAICTLVGLCAGDSAYAVPSHSLIASVNTVKSSAAVGDLENCMMCKVVIAYVKSALSKNATEEELMAEMKNACAILPTELQGECDTLVEKYAPQILKFIAADVDANTICTKLGMCSASFGGRGVPGLIHLFNRSGEKQRQRSSNV